MKLVCHWHTLHEILHKKNVFLTTKFRIFTRSNLQIEFCLYSTNFAKIDCFIVRALQLFLVSRKALGKQTYIFYQFFVLRITSNLLNVFPIQFYYPLHFHQCFYLKFCPSSTEHDTDCNPFFALSGRLMDSRISLRNNIEKCKEVEDNHHFIVEM